MGKPLKSKKKAAAAAKKKEMEEQALKEQAAAEDEYEFQKACLEIRVKELETLNLGLQRKSEYLESQNDVYKAQLADLKEEKEDLVNHLTRCYSAEKTNVKELEDRLYGTHRAMLDERSAYEQKLKNKDKTFEEMEERLGKKIMDLEAKMTALEDFRIQKENLTNERENLKNTLASERQRFNENYDELENNLIRYRERVKNESIEMIKQMATDVQQAGKLCLTATVKSAIAKNARLQGELETTSKDNLKLRQKLKISDEKLRDKRMTIEVIDEENALLHKKCLQYRVMSQELLDRLILLEQQLENRVRLENELVDLKAAHALCKTDEEIQQQLAEELEKAFDAEQEKAQVERDSQVDPRDKLISKLQNAIVRMAVASKCMSQATTPEEMKYLKDKFKDMLVKIFNLACEVPNLPIEIQQILVSSAPQVTPLMSFHMEKQK